MEPKRILVPVDFSRDSRYALARADTIAERGEGTLTLLHVHPVVQAVFMDATLMESPEHLVPTLSALEDHLSGWADDVKTPRDRVDFKVALGRPAEEIVKEAANHDLIVIASHGSTGLSRFLMGSVAERVVRGAPCSVLVIKRHGAKRLE